MLNSNQLIQLLNEIAITTDNHAVRIINKDELQEKYDITTEVLDTLESSLHWTYFLGYEEQY